MRHLQIELFTPTGQRIEKIRAAKLDATNNLTIISTARASNKESDVIRWPQNIDHWNICAGMVTIYYNNGYYVEILKVND